MNEHDITPNVQMMLYQMHHRHRTWHTCMAEMIDNSLDAGAEQVIIEGHGGKLEISDDGCGATEEKMLAMVHLGQHEEHDDNPDAIGRYGIGAKDVATWVWACQTIFSAVDGAEYWLRLNWPTLRKWTTPAPTCEHRVQHNSLPVREHGTLVRFTAMKRKFPSGKPFQSLCSQLAVMFGPGLRSGKRITLQNGNSDLCVLTANDPPSLESDLQVNSEYKVGLYRATLFAGVVQGSSPNPEYGVNINYGHRVVDRNTGFGCNGYNTGQLYARLTLYGTAWPLETNKGKIDVVDELCYRELEEWVFVLLQPLLERARIQELSTNVGELQSILTERLQMTMHNLKGKRAARENSGTPTVKPISEGGKHKRIRNTQPGQRKIRPPAASLTVFFTHMGDKGKVANVDLTQGSVYLNLDHPAIGEAVYSQPRGDELLLSLAFASVAHEWVDGSTDRDGQHQIFPHLANPDVTFDEVLASLLTANLEAGAVVA